MDVMDVMDVIDLWMAKAQIERLISANESSPTTEFWHFDSYFGPDDTLDHVRPHKTQFF